MREAREKRRKYGNKHLLGEAIRATRPKFYPLLSEWRKTKRERESEREKKDGRETREKEREREREREFSRASCRKVWFRRRLLFVLKPLLLPPHALWAAPLGLLGHAGEK